MDRVANQDGKKKPEMKKIGQGARDKRKLQISAKKDSSTKSKIGETYRPGTIDKEYEKAKKKNKSK